MSCTSGQRTRYRAGFLYHKETAEDTEVLFEFFSGGPSVNQMGSPKIVPEMVPCGWLMVAIDKRGGTWPSS